MKTLLIGCLLWASLLTACKQEYVPAASPHNCTTDFSTHPQNAHYTAELEQYATLNKLPGAVMLLKKANEPVWIGATGKADLENQTSLTLCGQVRAGSITKTFLAALVLELKDQGKLGLDEKLVNLLPDVAPHLEGADQVTVRQLLTHTSGIFDPTNESTAYQLDLVNDPQRIASLSADQFLARYVYGTAVAFRAGARYSYSNTNYLLLGKIVEHLTQKSLQTALQELILAPLGMRDTYLEKRDDYSVARGYSYFYGGNRLVDVTHLDRAEGDGRAFAGLITTVPDMYKFSEALFGGHLLSAASLAEMLATQPFESGTSEYGLGIDTWHSAMGVGRGNTGSSAGLEFNWYYFPDRQSTFILFANRGGGTYKDFLDKLIMQ